MCAKDKSLWNKSDYATSFLLLEFSAIYFTITCSSTIYRTFYLGHFRFNLVDKVSSRCLLLESSAERRITFGFFRQL